MAPKQDLALFPYTPYGDGRGNSNVVTQFRTHDGLGERVRFAARPGSAVWLVGLAG